MEEDKKPGLIEGVGSLLYIGAALFAATMIVLGMFTFTLN